MIINKHLSQPSWSINVSEDGYIRLTEKMLKQIPIKHLDSGIYPSNHCQNQTAARHCDLSGYTEWGSETVPAISIGWDWQLQHKKNPPAYEIVGKPFSNILLQDDANTDLPADKNLELLSRLIDLSEWAANLETCITKKYA